MLPAGGGGGGFLGAGFGEEEPLPLPLPLLLLVVEEEERGAGTEERSASEMAREKAISRKKHEGTGLEENGSMAKERPDQDTVLVERVILRR
jgi:hypothetical protein